MRSLLLSLTLSFVVGAAFAQYVPTNGLVAYYPFDGNANDHSGNNYHMVVSGATPTLDRYFASSKAYNFDGINDLIAYNSVLPLGAQFTWSFWARIDTFQNSALVFNGNTNSSGYGFGINSGTNPSQGSFGHKITFFSGGINYNISMLYQLHKWHHIVLTKNGQKFKLYIDNMLKDSSTSNWFTPVGKFHVGLDYTDNTNPFKGDVDDIAIYNRVLTPTEIDSIFNGCGPHIVTQPVSHGIPSGSNAKYYVASNSGPATYQWQINTGVGYVNLVPGGSYSGITSDTLRVNNPQANTSFRAIVMSYRNCPDTSFDALLTIWPTSITDNPSGGRIRIFPNPTSGSFTVDATNMGVEDGIIRVSDMIGRQLYAGHLKLIGGSQHFKANLPSGIYVVHIYDSRMNLQAVTKLIVN